MVFCYLKAADASVFSVIFKDIDKMRKNNHPFNPGKIGTR